MNVNNPGERGVDRNIIGENVDSGETKFTREKVNKLRRLINDYPILDNPEFIGREFAVDIPESSDGDKRLGRNLGLGVQLFHYGQFEKPGEHFPEMHLGIDIFHKDSFQLVDRLELDFDDKNSDGFGITSCKITSASDSLFSFPDESHDDRREDGKRVVEYNQESPMSVEGRAELRNRLDYAIGVLEGK